MLRDKAMPVLDDSLRSLMAHFQGDRGTSQSEGESQFERGCVWHGDWHTKADKGHFGAAYKRNHNAAISQPGAGNQYFAMAPITSKRNSCSVHLPPGSIPGGQYTSSYLLRKSRLRASKRTLLQHFTYKVTLSHEIMDEYDSL